MISASATSSPLIRLRLTQPNTDLITPSSSPRAASSASSPPAAPASTEPRHLNGKRIAAPETDAGRQFFPAFAQATGIDLASIRWITVTPQLREPMLARGEADAITGFETSGMSLAAHPWRRAGRYHFDPLCPSWREPALHRAAGAAPYAEANPRVVTGSDPRHRPRPSGSLGESGCRHRRPDAAGRHHPAALERERMLANFEFIRTPEVLQGGLG